MKDWKAFLHNLEESLDAMDKNIDDLASRAHEADTERHVLEELRQKHARAKEKADELRNASEAEAEDLHAEAHTVWEDLKEAFSKVRSRLGD